MNLPDFIDIKEFKYLRKTMGARLVTNWKNIDSVWEKPDIDKILETVGKDIEIKDIEINDDGTLNYEGHRVLVYIRDARTYSYYGSNTKANLPKFHLSWCRTLKNMKSKGRYNKRYVATKRDDGLFLVNIEHDEKTVEEERELYPCRNCLRKLSYPKNREEFDIKEFFNKYEGTQIEEIPLFDEYDAPKDEYPDDWNKISWTYRKNKNWICEECGRNMRNNKKNLHVHHINGNRSDCRYSNLKSLCVDCHGLEPYHGHMKSK